MQTEESSPPNRRASEQKPGKFPSSLEVLQASEAQVILLTAPILLIVWAYYGTQGSFAWFFGPFRGHWEQDVYGAIYEYLVAFLLLFCVPALVVKRAFKGKLRDFGLRAGDARTGMHLVAIGIPILLLMTYTGSADPAMQAEYPLAKSTANHSPLFLAVEICYLIYYLGWEFFFRGFMLFGLEKQYGAVTAILIQTIPSAIMHVGKPSTESFAAIFAGLMFGYVAIRTRSILYPLLFHGAVGISMDIFVTLRSA